MTDLIGFHLDALRAESLADDTVRDREYWLHRLDRDLQQRHQRTLEDPSPDELRSWLGNPDWSPATRETAWCHMRGFYRWAVGGRRPHLDYDPSEDIPKPKRRYLPPRVARDDHLRLALERLGPPARRPVILAAGAGMRAGEVARADREDFTDEWVVIEGKGGKVRRVPVVPEVWDEIRDEPDGRLVRDSRGAEVDPKWVTYTVSRALDKVGLGHLTLHFFRGSFATRLRRSGVDVQAISRLLGHSQISTTLRYLEFDDGDLEAAVAKLPPLAESPRGARAGY